MASRSIPQDAMSDAAALADVIETVLKMALAPVVDRLRAVEATGVDLSVVRERVAALTALQPVPGPPGPPGADGLGFDDFAVDYDGERSLTLRWSRGDAVVERVAKLPTVIYRGVFVAGKVYERGDVVTTDGSMWHCNVETTTRPADGVAAWSLAVKRGRDANRGRT